MADPSTIARDRPVGSMPALGGISALGSSSASTFGERFMGSNFDSALISTSSVLEVAPQVYEDAGRRPSGQLAAQVCMYIIPRDRTLTPINCPLGKKPHVFKWSIGVIGDWPSIQIH
jgi:hypothetical protein